MSVYSSIKHIEWRLFDFLGAVEYPICFLFTGQFTAEQNDRHTYIQIVCVNTENCLKCTETTNRKMPKYLFWTATILKKYAFLLIINFYFKLFLNRIIEASYCVRFFSVCVTMLIILLTKINLWSCLFCFRYKSNRETTDEYRKRQSSSGKPLNLLVLSKAILKYPKTMAQFDIVSGFYVFRRSQAVCINIK